MVFSVVSQANAGKKLREKIHGRNHWTPKFDAKHSTTEIQKLTFRMIKLNLFFTLTFLNFKTWILILKGIECLTYVRERQVNAFAVASEWRFPSIEFSILKVSKSQKHFFLKIYCPKNKQKISALVG